MKFLETALLLFATFVVISSHPSHSHTENIRRQRSLVDEEEAAGGTSQPNEADHSSQRMALHAFKAARGNETRSAITTIPVCFFVITDDDGTNNRTNELLQGNKISQSS
jgi:hypothetical protein